MFGTRATKVQSGQANEIKVGSTGKEGKRQKEKEGEREREVKEDEKNDGDKCKQENGSRPWSTVCCGEGRR